MMSLIFRSLVGRAALAVLSLSALLVAAPARAEVVFENTFEPSSTSRNVVTDSRYFATGFTTGGSILPLASIDLGIAVPTGTVNPGVEIFAGTGSAPTGSALVSLTTSTPVTGPTQTSYTFTPSTPFSFSAGTNYYVRVSAPTGQTFDWYQSDAAPTAQNSSGWSALPGARSQDGGATYTANGGAGLGYISVVPEPSTFALASIGLATIVGLEARRRFRRQGRE